MILIHMRTLTEVPLNQVIPDTNKLYMRPASETGGLIIVRGTGEELLHRRPEDVGCYTVNEDAWRGM